jgi:hypothetical protein
MPAHLAQRQEEVRQIIDVYSEGRKGSNSLNEDVDSAFDKLSPKDIVLKPFEMEMLVKEGATRATATDFNDEDRKGVKNFLSTPRFIKALSDLSDDLIGLPD